MSFAIALSGLNAAGSELSVTSNNIANVGTHGFKGSRAEFADVYSVNSFSTSKTAIGSGVLLSQVRQQFNQGSLEYTDNGLDLAINGSGFFMTSTGRDTLDPAYTRAGSFGVDANGYVVNSQGQFLQVFPVDPDDGTVISTSFSSAGSLQVPDSFGAPSATTEVTLGVNLPSGAPDLPIANFDPQDTSTFTQTTSTTVYDSLGNPHTLQAYFIKTDSANNTWETRTFLDGNQLTPQVTEDLAFNASGILTTPADGLVHYSPETLTNGANPLSLTLNYLSANGTDTTQFSSPFSIASLTQNGAGTGRLNGLEVTEDGTVQGNYTNGESRALGKLVIADFPNAEGLRQVGNTMWRETVSSGQVLVGEAGTGRFGSIQASALETSNVELTSQLVKLITAQRNFQANAKSIETSSTVTQTIINI
ncbi:MAG TPA: flagellar hook protein FlgE [Gammaproteobacteria bacterium]|nr:flagellar hook protein FlgE [Gammaproteobacteria bacterium]